MKNEAAGSSKFASDLAPAAISSLQVVIPHRTAQLTRAALKYAASLSNDQSPKEIDLLHGIWLELSNEVAPDEIHHHDVVHVALEELQRDMRNSKRREVIGNLRQHLYKIRNRRVPVLGARRE